MHNNIPQNARPIITNDHNEKHVYVFEPQAVDAVNAALAINRPLLIRGNQEQARASLPRPQQWPLAEPLFPLR